MLRIARLAPQHTLDQRRELARALERRLLPVLDDGRRDGARAPLLAKPEQDIRDLVFLECIDNIGRAPPRARHPHVERPVAHEGEAALRLVELHGGNAEVQHNAVHPVPADGARRVLHLREWRLDQPEPPARGGFEPAASRNGRGIAVEGQHAAIHRIEDRARIAARTVCAVNEALRRPRLERSQHFLKEHRDVTDRFANGRRALYRPPPIRHYLFAPSLAPLHQRLPAPSPLRSASACSRAPSRNLS